MLTRLLHLWQPCLRATDCVTAGLGHDLMVWQDCCSELAYTSSKCYAFAVYCTLGTCL